MRQEAGQSSLPVPKGSAVHSTNRIRLVVLCGLGFLGLVTTALLIFHQPLSLSNQPLPDAHEYLNAADRLALGHGYTTTVRDNAYSPHASQLVNPPRFPPGTSLVLAPFGLIGHYPGNIELGARLVVVALVIATGWAAYSLAGWFAALVAIVIAATSQFVLLNSHVVMSDALGALLIVICLPLMKLEKRWSVFLLGFVAGYGLVVRESGVVVLLCLLIVMSGWDRLRLAAGAIPPALGLALYNWSAFGAPWRTGYSYWLGSFHEYDLSYVTRHPWPPGGEEDYYSVSLHFLHLIQHTHAGWISLLPNIWFYPLIVLGFSTVFGPPWLTLLGLVAAAWWWRQREARFTLLLAVLAAIIYMPNYGQDPRYMAGPCYLLTAWALAAIVHIVRWVRTRYGEQIAAFLAPAPVKRVA